MKGFHIDEGWIMIILLSCLGLALTFVNFGLGLVNLAQAQEMRVQPPLPPSPPPRPAPEPADRRLEEARQQARQFQDQIDYWGREAGQRRQQAGRQEQARDQARASLAEARIRLAASQTQTRGLEAAVAARRSQQASQQARRPGSEPEQAAAQLAALRRQIEQAEQRERDLQQQLRDSDLVDPGQLCGGKCAGQKPQYVECHGQGVTLQPQGVTVRLAQLQNNRDSFRNALGAQRYVLFLIRPSGIEAFKAARPIVEGKGFEFGFEPVDEKWRFRYQVQGVQL